MFVTLPVTPRLNKPVVSIATLLYADVFSKVANDKLSLLLNTSLMDNHSSMKVYAELNSYTEMLGWLKIDKTLLSFDDSLDFTSFVNASVHTLSKLGLVLQEKVDISFCSCGKVEIPTSVLNVAIKQNRHTLFIKSGQFTVCALCGSKINHRPLNVLVLRLPEFKLPSHYPEFYGNELQAVQKRVLEQPIVITRHFRQGQKTEIGGKSYVLDNDFRWLFSILYQCKNSEAPYLVSGQRTLNQAMKCIGISNALGCSSIALIVHPRVNVFNNTSIISDLDLSDIKEANIPYGVLRAFFCMGLQWTKHESVINTKELYLITETFEKYINNIDPLSSHSPIDFKLLQRANFQSIYKKIRNKTELTDEETYILKCVWIG